MSVRVIFSLIGLLAGAVANAGEYQIPRLGDGTPDLQGYWSNSTATPLERESKYGDRRALTDEEAAAISHAAISRVEADAKPTDPNAPPPKAEALPPVGNYNLFWTDRGMHVTEINGEYRTSMIIDPPNGRIPRRNRNFAVDDGGEDDARMMRSNDGPEGRGLGERCLLGFGSTSGPPMLPTMYNSYYQFIQAPGYMVILVEMVHDARIIPIGDNLKHDTRSKWMGDSIGHWEGDTLVVETTNFRKEQSFRGSSPSMVVTERFTRTADDKILYQFTIDDPKAFAKPFTGELNFKTSNEPIYEYACHEGNYGLEGILQGARRLEDQEASKKK